VTWLTELIDTQRNHFFAWIRLFSCKAVFLCTKARRSSLYRRNLLFWLFFSGTFPFKMLWTHSNNLRPRFFFPFSVMALHKEGSALARRQRHNAVLFRWADISNDGCDYDMFLFISLECKRTRTFPSQVGRYSAGAKVPVWTVSSLRIGSEIQTLRLWLHHACIFARPGYICFAKLTTCVMYRWILKRTMYCAFMVMVLHSVLGKQLHKIYNLRAAMVNLLRE